jgi:hypothetical protein
VCFFPDVVEQQKDTKFYFILEKTATETQQVLETFHRNEAVPRTRDLKGISEIERGAQEP